MNILLCMVLIVLALLLSGVVVWYQKAYIDGSKPPLKDSLKQQKVLLAVTAAAFTAITVLGLLTQEQKHLRTAILIQDLLLWEGTFCLMLTDVRVKKIPNAVTLLLLLIRCVFLAWDILIEHADAKFEILHSLFGMFVGGTFILVCMMVSKGGIGAGDLKLFAVIGLYFGFQGLFQIMLYSLLLSSVWSIGLLLFRKAKLKSTLPMAPFILAGLTVYYIFLSNVE